MLCESAAESAESRLSTHCDGSSSEIERALEQREGRKGGPRAWADGKEDEHHATEICLRI